MDLHSSAILRMIFVVFSSLVFVFAAHGQDEEENFISTQVSFFPLDGGSWDGLYFLPEGGGQDDLQSIRFNPLARSTYFNYEGPRELNIFAKGRAEDGTKEIVPLGTVPLDAGAERQILLIEECGDLITELHPELTFSFRRGPRRELSAFVFVDSANTFPPESIVFFNTMSATFFGILGEERLSITPGLNPPIRLSGVLERNVRMGLALHDGDRNRRVLDNHFRFGTDRRTLFILRPPAREGSLRIRSQRLTEYLGE